HQYITKRNWLTHKLMINRDSVNRLKSIIKVLLGIKKYRLVYKKQYSLFNTNILSSYGKKKHVLDSNLLLTRYLFFKMRISKTSLLNSIATLPLNNLFNSSIILNRSLLSCANSNDLYVRAVEFSKWHKRKWRKRTS